MPGARTRRIQLKWRTVHGFGRDVDQHQAAVAEVTRELDGVASIGLSMLAGAAWDQRRRGEVARDAPLCEGALEHVAGTRSFVACADGAFGLQALNVAADLLEIVGQAIDAQGLGVAVAEHGDGDRPVTFRSESLHRDALRKIDGRQANQPGRSDQSSDSPGLRPPSAVREGRNRIDSPGSQRRKQGGQGADGEYHSRH